MEFICKIASVKEMEEKWDYEIAKGVKDKANLIVRKERNIERYRKSHIIPYYGMLDGRVICEATAMLCPDDVQNSAGLVGEHTVYLSAFRTADDLQGKGYFSRLFRFMIDDLRNMGYSKATLGVEPDEKRNRAIYTHYGFTEHIKSGIESYPDGTVIAVDYYGKAL